MSFSKKYFLIFQKEELVEKKISDIGLVPDFSSIAIKVARTVLCGKKVNP